MEEFSSGNAIDNNNITGVCSLVLNLPDNLYKNYRSIFNNLPPQISPVLWRRLEEPHLISYNSGRCIVGLDGIQAALKQADSTWIQEFTKGTPNQLPIWILQIDIASKINYDKIMEAINSAKYIVRIITVEANEFIFQNATNDLEYYEGVPDIIKCIQTMDAKLQAIIDI